jgi:SNF2 family DNA or RNA helicase
MKITLKPVENRKETPLAAPDTALQYHIRDLRRDALKRQITLEIPDKQDDTHLVIKVKPQGKKEEKIQVFDKNYKYLSCSCDTYVKNQSGFCVHLAALLNAKKFADYYDFNAENYREWRTRLKNYSGLLVNDVDTFDGEIEIFRPSQNSTIKIGNGKNNKKIKADSAKKYYEVMSTGRRTNIPWLTEEFEKKENVNDDKLLLNDINLYDYQKEVFKKMVTARRAICSMTMGAGKTLTTITCFAHINKIKELLTKESATLLVVAPKSLKVQWSNELKRACGLDSFQIDKASDIAESRNHNICVITYQLLGRNIDKIKERKFDTAVVDEIQYVRNGNTKTWKALSQIKSDYFFGLSGTIIENRLDDLYAIMNIIDTHILGPKWKFDDKFQKVKIKAKEKIIYHGAQNLVELKQSLKDVVFSYDNLKLPPITHEYIQLDINERERKSHDYYQEEAKKLIAKSLSGEVSFKEKLMIQGLLLKARQSVNSYELLTKKPQDKPSNKIKEFLKLIEHYCINNNEKVVVFSEWTQMLDILSREVKVRFKHSSVESVLFTGKQNGKQRTAAVQTFQSDPKCKIFFASDAGGVGLDGLQLASSRVIHTELPWNPAKLDQRSARVHRIGQKNPVEIKYLVSKGTIEEEIYNSILQKRQLRINTLSNFNVAG